MPRYVWRIKEDEPKALLAELQYKEIYSARLRENTMPPFHNISLYRGNDKTYHFTVKDALLNYVDITDSSAKMVWAREADAEPCLTLSTEVEGQGRIEAGCYGDVYFFVKPEDTKALEPRQYVFNVIVTLGNGKTYTVAQGVINLVGNFA